MFYIAERRNFKYRYGRAAQKNADEIELRKIRIESRGESGFVGAMTMDDMNLTYEMPPLDQPELGEALKSAILSRDKTAGPFDAGKLATEILLRFGGISSVPSELAELKKSILTSLKLLYTKRPRRNSEYLIFAEAILGVVLNSTGRLTPEHYVDNCAQKLRLKVAQWFEKEGGGDITKSQCYVAQTTRRNRIVEPVTDVVDTESYKVQLQTRGNRVFATIVGPGGAMLLVESAASIRAQVPTRLRDVPEAYGLKVSGDSMSGMIEPGAVVWVNPTLAAVRGFVLIVPNDVTDVRRYVRRLVEITDTDFVGEQSNPPGQTFFPREHFHCLKITDITENV